MYKVFINDHPLYLLDKSEIFQPSSSCFWLIDAAETEIKCMVDWLFEEKSEMSLCLQFENISKGWQVFQNAFRIIEAAGGLVQNEEGETLAIYRFGKWDFPKGKMEKGENPKESALREVQEECGIEDVEIAASLPDTFHIYRINSDSILKRTYWFKMKSSSSQQLIPQKEEGIEKVEWMNKSDLEEFKQNTYPSLLDLLS